MSAVLAASSDKNHYTKLKTTHFAENWKMTDKTSLYVQ